MENKMFAKVFLWMFIGLAVSFGIGFYISNNPVMIENIFNKSTIIILMIIEIAVVLFLSLRINKMEPMTAKILFLVYSGITGVTLTSIFVVYQLSSIVFVFLISAILFLIFGLIGAFTNLDLTKLGTILLMALIGLVIATIINIFVGSEHFDLALNGLCLIIFLVYVAYDIQKIKRMPYYIQNEENAAIYGALQLYIDFINILLSLLRFLGKAKD